MRKITIQRSDYKYDLHVDAVKYLIIDDFKTKYKILQTIKQYFDLAKSEYREETDDKSEIYMNDKPLPVSRTSFRLIDTNYSINEDFKLKTGSLALRYLELKFMQLELFDSINTINILFESLAEEFNDTAVITNQFTSMFAKQLVKISNIQFTDEELAKDEYDLDYEELIILQLTMLEYIISKETKKEFYFVIVDIPQMSEVIVNALNKLKKDNVIILVLCQNYVTGMDDDIAVITGSTIDFQDDDGLYIQLSNTVNQFMTKTEVKNRMKECILKRYMQSKRTIINDFRNFISE